MKHLAPGQIWPMSIHRIALNDWEWGATHIYQQMALRMFDEDKAERLYTFAINSFVGRLWTGNAW